MGLCSVACTDTKQSAGPRAVNKILSRRRYFESRWLWGPEGPPQVRGLGAAEAPSGVQGQSPVGVPGGKAPGSKMSLTF